MVICSSSCWRCIWTNLILNPSDGRLEMVLQIHGLIGASRCKSSLHSMCYNGVCLTLQTTFGFFLAPTLMGARASTADKFRQFDLPGTSILFAANTLLVLGLQLGATSGFRTAAFVVPFLLCWPLFALFFIWEGRLPESECLIPPAYWKLPNFSLLVFLGLNVFSYFAVSLLSSLTSK
jgi:hypothetical protein